MGKNKKLIIGLCVLGGAVVAAAATAIIALKTRKLVKEIDDAMDTWDEPDSVCDDSDIDEVFDSAVPEEAYVAVEP